MAAYQANEGCLSGNCKFCGQNTDCVLLAVLQKVTGLEDALKQISGQAG
jgi:hypothetical protein